MVNPRLDLLTDYPFQRLTALLQGKPGAEPLVMSIGEPQHRPPAFVAEILAAESAGWGKYPPMAGSPDFRKAAGGWLMRRFGLAEGTFDPDSQLIPLAGTREGLYQIAQLVVPDSMTNAKPGAKPPVVLLPNPFYQVYAGAALMAGAEPVFVPAAAETGFLPDYAALPDDILSRTALAYLCTPGNPQGAVATLAQLKDAVLLARKWGFVLAVDECYSEIYDSDAAKPAGALEACRELGGSYDNVVVFHSLSKRSSAPGLRSGFVAGDPKLIAPFARLRAYAGATIPSPILAASAALWRDEDHVTANRAAYRAKFDVAQGILGNRMGFYRPQGGFFLWLNVGDGEQAARALWEKAGIRVLPGAYLARPGADGINPGHPYIRVALVHDLEIVHDAMTRFSDLLTEA